MGLRGKDTNKQIEGQVKRASESLLAVMNLLQRPGAFFPEESQTYLDAIERRAMWIRQRIKSSERIRQAQAEAALTEK